MMTVKEHERQRRLSIAEDQADRFRDVARGIILTGSVVYAPDEFIRPDSDIDLVVVTDALRAVANRLGLPDSEVANLGCRYFEGYCVKQFIDGIPLSLHILSSDAVDIITKCFVADIRVYRPRAKEQVYDLCGFDGDSYRYTIKNIELPDLFGVRTIVPISFIHDDRYHIGIHRDKLLSLPKILYDQDHFVEEKLDKLWAVVVANLRDESMRRIGSVDLERMSVWNALSRHDRMRPGADQEIHKRTEYYLQRSG